MKRILVCLLAISGTVSSALAQDDYQSGSSSKVRFGAYIAPNLSWLQPTAGKSDDGQFTVKGNGSKVGYSWGLAADIYFAENYGIATGFQLTTTGGSLLTNNTDSVRTPRTVRSTDFTYHAQYLEVPFGLKLRSDELGKMRFFGQIGLALGFNIGKKADYTVIYQDADNQEQEVSGEKEKMVGSLTMAPIMLQLNVGAGIEYSISGKMALYTGIFFNNGFLPDAVRPDKFSFPYEGTFSDGNTRMNNLALRVGLFF